MQKATSWQYKVDTSLTSLDCVRNVPFVPQYVASERLTRIPVVFPNCTVLSHLARVSVIVLIDH